MTIPESTETPLDMLLEPKLEAFDGKPLRQVEDTSSGRRSALKAAGLVAVAVYDYMWRDFILAAY